MKDLIPEASQVLEESIGLKLLEAHRFWSKKRWLFNVLVGSAGIFSILFFAYSFQPADLAGILIWGIIANGLYSFGHELDCYVISRSKASGSLQKYRLLLFWLGTIAYVVVTLLISYFYYSSLEI